MLALCIQHSLNFPNESRVVSQESLLQALAAPASTYTLDGKYFQIKRAVVNEQLAKSPRILADLSAKKARHGGKLPPPKRRSPEDVYPVTAWPPQSTQYEAAHMMAMGPLTQAPGMRVCCGSKHMKVECVHALKGLAACAARARVIPARSHWLAHVVCDACGGANPVLCLLLPQ